ncbi:MAG: hypothetical protein QGF33_13880, partial [Alphaproteobacteria bacterium]|nr:hypothetical protein [Alphaproteobacteria bacterium]
GEDRVGAELGVHAGGRRALVVHQQLSVEDQRGHGLGARRQPLRRLAQPPIALALLDRVARAVGWPTTGKGMVAAADAAAARKEAAAARRDASAAAADASAARGARASSSR